MSEIYKVSSVDELLHYMDHGYYFSRLHIQTYFKIKKSQYYDYISNNVSKVKVPKGLWENLSREQIEKRYYNNPIGFAIIKNSSVLLNIDEVFLFMINSGYFKVSLFNKREEVYEDITAEYILNDTDDDLENSLNLLERALVKSKKRQDFDYRFIDGNKSRSENYKTRQTRFYSKIKNFNHFRFEILGVYTYAIIEDIGDDLPEVLMLKQSGYNFMNKFRNA